MERLNLYLVFKLVSNDVLSMEQKEIYRNHQFMLGDNPIGWGWYIPYGELKAPFL